MFCSLIFVVVGGVPTFSSVFFLCHSHGRGIKARRQYPSPCSSRFLSRDRRRLEEAAEGKHSALAESSRDAERAATTARERISRIEAEHALALRENGKASVRQRALERELARIKSRCQKQIQDLLLFTPRQQMSPVCGATTLLASPCCRRGFRKKWLTSGLRPWAVLKAVWNMSMCY